MKNNEKLKIVFDFIADYLSEEETTQSETSKEEPIEFTENDKIVETPFSSNLKRAYTLMKTMEDKDKENAIVKREVKKVVDPIKEELNRVKAEYNEKILKDKAKEDTRTGVTLDDDGNLIKVEVPNLTEDFIETIKNNPPMTAEQWDEIVKEGKEAEETEAQVKTTKIKKEAKPKK